jgi:hypothetical protein
MSRRRILYFLNDIHERFFGAEGLYGGPFLLAAQEKFHGSFTASGIAPSGGRLLTTNSMVWPL